MEKITLDYSFKLPTVVLRVAGIYTSELTFLIGRNDNHLEWNSIIFCLNQYIFIGVY